MTKPQSNEDATLYANLYARYRMQIESDQQLDLVIAVITDYTKKNLERPRELILGYGTYIALCFTLSEHQGYVELQKVSKFAGCEIIVNRETEFEAIAAKSSPPSSWNAALSALAKHLEQSS